MIKGINTGIGLQVDGGYTSWPQFYNNSTASNNTLVGQVRYNGASQNMEIYDGNSWLTLTSVYPTVNLSQDVQNVIAWAKHKMVEEARIKELAAKHPAVADAVNAVNRANEQLKIVTALAETE